MPFAAENTVRLQTQKGVEILWFTASSLSWEHWIGISNDSSPEPPTEEVQRKVQVWVLAAEACWEKQEAAKGTGRQI